MPKLDLAFQGDIKQDSTKFYPTGASTAIASAIVEIGRDFEAAQKISRETADTQAFTGFVKRNAELEAELQSMQPGQALAALQDGKSHETALNEYLKGLPEDVRQRIEPRLQAYSVAQWSSAFGQANTAVRQEAKDALSGLITEIGVFGADMTANDLQASSMQAAVSIERLEALGVSTDNMRARLDRTFKGVQVEKGKRMVDADLTSPAPESRARLAGATESIENFRATYGQYMNETHWRRAASALDAQERREQAERNRIFRENQAFARAERSDNERALMQSVTVFAQDMENRLALLKDSPTAPLELETVQANLEMLQAEARGLAAQGAKSAARFAATSEPLMRELTAYKDAQEVLTASPDGYKAVAMKARELLADPEVPSETKRAWLNVARSTQQYIDKNGVAAFAATVRGRELPLTAPEAHNDAEETRDVYGRGTSGYTRGQAADLYNSIVEGDTDQAFATMAQVQAAATPRQRSRAALELRNVPAGDGTAKSALYGLLSTDLAPKDQQAAALGFKRKQQGEWIEFEAIRDGSKSIDSATAEKIRQAFPDPVAEKSVYDANTVLYLGDGGRTLENFDGSAWKDRLSSLWPGEDFKEVNGRWTLGPSGLNLKQTLKNAGGESALNFYGNGIIDLKGAPFEAFLDGVYWVRQEPGKYSFVSTAGSNEPIKTTDGKVFVLDLEGLIGSKPEATRPDIDNLRLP